MKECQIYRTNKNYIIVTISKTEEWIRIDDEPIFCLPLNTSKNEFENKILQSINSSRLNIKNPTRKEEQEWQRQNLDKMGQQSYNILYKNSKSCRIIEDEEQKGKIIVIPYTLRVKGKPSQGIAPITEKKIELLKNETKNLFEIVELVLSNEHLAPN
jgi:hypothetical protein